MTAVILVTSVTGTRSTRVSSIVRRWTCQTRGCGRTRTRQAGLGTGWRSYISNRTESPTRTKSVSPVVILSCVTGTGTARNCSLIWGRTCQTRSCGRTWARQAGLGAGWSICYNLTNFEFSPAQVATLLSNYPVLQGQVFPDKVL